MKTRIPNHGLLDQLESILHPPALALVGWDLVLFVTELEDIPPAFTLADVVEATFTGYARRTLEQEGWSAAAMEGNRAVSVWGSVPVSWLCSGAPETIAGIALIDPMSERVELAELLEPPIVLAAGGRVEVIPRFTYTNEVLE